MDVTSYLLGKQQGGGGTPNLQNKDVTITENGETNVSADAGYDGLQNVGITTNVQPDLESKSVTITENTTTTITPSQGKDGLSSVEVITNVSGTSEYTVKIDTSLAASSFGMNGLITKISPDLDTSQRTDFRWFFYNCANLTEIPAIDTSNATMANNMFEGCTNLTTIPVLDFKKLNNSTNIFRYCPNFTDQTLDNILVTLSNVSFIVSYNQRLSEQGFTSSNYPASRIQALPHYQDFINAGWIIGY